MSVYYKILTNAATMRLGAEQMVKTGLMTTTGEKFSMELWDSWDEVEQRNFLVEFFIRRWDDLTPAAKDAEISAMPQKCHKCGLASSDLLAREGRTLAPDAGVGYSALYCSICAMKVLANTPTTMLITLRPHNNWSWEPREGARVRLHSLKGRADLNGKVGRLVCLVEASGRWGVRVDASSESIQVKPTNFTSHQLWKLKLPADGSTPIRDVIEQVRARVGMHYRPSQFSLWRAGVLLGEDTVDAAGAAFPARLRDYAADDDLQDPATRMLDVLITPLNETTKDAPQEVT